MFISLADCIKYFRRMSYVHGPDWRTMVIAPSTTARDFAVREAVSMMEAGSLDYNYDVTRHEILTMRGSLLSFVTEEQAERRYTGSATTHIAFTDQNPSQLLISRAEYQLTRASRVPAKDTRLDIVSV